MHLPAFIIRNKVNTIKQNIQSVRIKMAISLSVLLVFIMTFISIFAFEFSRVTKLSYTEIAEVRINNSGMQRADSVTTSMEFAFQDVTIFSTLMEEKDLEDTDGSISKEKVNEVLSTIIIDPYFIDDVGVIFDGQAYFGINLEFDIGITDVKENEMIAGARLQNAQKENLYFIIPLQKNTHHTKITGFVGVISIEKFERAIHSDVYNNESTTLILNQDGDIITYTSGVHKWRFEDFDGMKFTNLTDAMKVWVSEPDYQRYLDFMQNPESKLFNAGTNDRDGMFYKSILSYGDQDSPYILVFMAPKYLLTNQTINLTNISIGAFFVSVFVGTIFVVLLSVLVTVLYIRRKRENAFDQKTGLHREEQFFYDAQAILLQNPSSSFGLVFMNIKNFAKINNDYGSQIGDAILDQVGRKVFKQFEMSNVDVTGYQHGDKFLLLLKGDSDEVLYKLTELNNALSETTFENNQKLTFSYGTKITDHQHALDLHSEMDCAKYSEKNSTSNNAFSFYDEQMIARQKERDDLNGRFEEALKNEEFEVFLQLKWGLKKNAWAGAEALCRWRDPIKGIIPPGKFIPLFEENGKIVRLDAYMFEQTCKIISKMLQNGEPCVPVSFNLSKRNFQDLSFMKDYEAIIEKYSIPHDLIEIEITEGLLVDNVESFTSFIKIFHENDFNISMDDFGAGYSSLNMIHQLDFDVIKIDAKFFRGGFDEANQIIVSSIINLCHKLNKIVVAEGIEEESEVEFLRNADCDIIQGYYFAKPLPVNEFKELLFSSPKQR